MHPDLINSGSPPLHSEEVRQEEIRSRTGKMPRPPPDEEQILVAIATNSCPVPEIARAAGVSILELARIVTTPRNLEDLDRVRQLHAIEREMLLGKLKRDALTRLQELTTEVPATSADEVRACEVMRKACVDILRYGDNPPQRERSPQGLGGPGSCGRRGESITPATEAEVLEALEKWGREENLYEPRARASGSVELAGSSKAEPQAMSGGREGVVGVEVTHDVQVGMAFGKTSDHGTAANRTDAASLGCHGQVPSARVCEKLAHPRANLLKQQPRPWHPIRNPLHQSRAPPLLQAPHTLLRLH